MHLVNLLHTSCSCPCRVPSALLCCCCISVTCSRDELTEGAAGRSHADGGSDQGHGGGWRVGWEG